MSCVPRSTICPSWRTKISSAFVYDSKTVVISVLGTYLNGMVLDHFIFGMGLKRRVCIVSDKELAIKEFILNDLHSGASIYESYGAYTMRRCADHSK